MYIGNMHKKLVKIARAVPEISDRTHRHRERHTHRQTDALMTTATAFAGEIIKVVLYNK